MPPVASAPALQWVCTVAPSGTSGSPASPMRWHIARSSSQIAWASTRRAWPSRSPSGTPAAQPRIRASAHARFTAVGRVACSVAAIASTARRVAEPPSWRTRAASPIAAAIPISGAPRTRSEWIASATSSTEERTR